MNTTHTFKFNRYSNFLCIIHSAYPLEVADELHNRLQTCHAYLAENLEQTELLNHLITEGVVTISDAEAIKAEKGAFKQNCFLLDLLQSKSSTQIEGMINCLLATNQIELAQSINPNGTEYIYLIK